MKVTVTYGESIKDVKGNLFHYKGEISKDILEDGLTPEQVVAKERAVHHFLHHEIHTAIQEQMVKDGRLDAVSHEIVRAATATPPPAAK